MTEYLKKNSKLLLFFLVIFFAFVILNNNAKAESITINASVPAICGNSATEGSETCDDGNTANNDGCSSVCQTESSGGGGLPPPPPPPPPCVSNGSCSAVAPACDQTTSGVDNCGTACSKTGAACECVPIQGSCNASEPTCETTTTVGKDNCGNDCTKTKAQCACVSNGSCNAVAPQCDQTTSGVDNCGKVCAKTGSKCACVPNPDSCNAIFPSCGQTTEGKDNCGNVCTKSGSSCEPTPPTPTPPAPPILPTSPEGTPGAGSSDGTPSAGGGGGGGGVVAEAIAPLVAPIVESIKTSIVNPIAEQVKKITEIKQVKEITTAVTANIKFVTRNITKASKAVNAEVNKIIKQAEVFSNDPEVQQATKIIAAPTTIAVSVAVAAPSLWSIVLPLARFLFLQPILVLGMKKRKEWGEIYNSLTKLPIDLATVRLIDAKTNKIIRSRVTDLNGRYLLSVPLGEYKIEVIKSNFTFPSALLKGVNFDGSRVDIYHGEILAVKEDAATITANIPIDPSGADKTPKRVFWEKRLRILQHIISIAGIVMTALYSYIAPTWYVISFLIIHIIMYSIFYFYATPKRPKGWGIVYEEGKKNPIGKAVARLFSKQYDKLVATEITDNKGRYAFLAGPNDYYVMVEKDGYDASTKEVTIQQNDSYIIKENLSLKKGDKS